MFAYELYHQLRLIWTKKPELKGKFFIHAEVRKGYQHLKDFDYMPDFLFHLPSPGQNFAVVEVKLACRSNASIEADIKKLARFAKELNYQNLFEILIGTEKEFEDSVSSLAGAGCGVPIDLLCLSTENHRLTHRRLNYP